ncbi:MAG TPA: multicopper oxidase domain-containing protein [Thermoplasmata archaeon]|nr:multicopper oxidase domain-containing protein [Thermoplasmata archaeon]
MAVIVLIAIAGTAGWLLTRSSAPVGPSYQPQVRQYYIASDPIVWNYSPSGLNELTGVPLGSPGKDIYVVTGSKDLANLTPKIYPMETFLKCIYRQYTDATFSTLVERSTSQAYLGLDGPVIYTAVGDTIRIEFRNNCSFPTSLRALGVTANATSGGTSYNGSSTGPGAAVAPGGTWNYSWQVTPSAGPGATDPSSVMWLYTDGAAPVNGTDTGMFGAIIVTSAAYANPNGTPDDVSANLVIVLGQLDESQSPYFAYNLAHYVPDNFSLTEGFVRYAINGYNYGNMPMIALNNGEHVRWYVANVGGATAVPFWGGNPLVYRGANVASAGLLPGTSTQLDMWSNNTGIWLLDSNDPGDLTGGMEARYTVLPGAVTALAPVGDAASALPIARPFPAVVPPALLRPIP